MMSLKRSRICKLKVFQQIIFHLFNTYETHTCIGTDFRDPALKERMSCSHVAVVRELL